MTRSRSPQGVPTAAMAAYYRRRAEHGVGLIVTEATGIGRPAAVNEPDVPRFHGEDALADWRTIVDEVHRGGGRIAPQLWHVGLKQSRTMPLWAPPGGFESPSGLSLSGVPVGEPMSEMAIIDTIAAFAQAASTAERLGFDGVELHGAHNYLIGQFFSGQLNRREDRYGGRSLIERSRFAIDVLAAIRVAVAPDFPVIFRLSQAQPKDHGARLADTPQILERWLHVLADAGADAFHLSEARIADAAFPDIDPVLSLAGWAKKLTGLPSIAVGSVGLDADTYASFAGKLARVAPLDDVLERLGRGEFDLVAVGRPLLQDAAWLEKVRHGRLDELHDFAPEALDVLA